MRPLAHKQCDVIKLGPAPGRFFNEASGQDQTTEAAEQQSWPGVQALHISSEPPSLSYH